MKMYAHIMSKKSGKFMSFKLKNLYMDQKSQILKNDNVTNIFVFYSTCKM